MLSGPRRQFLAKRRSAGFTLIELLVVLGIILILLSMFLIAGKYVLNSAHKSSTKAALATASSLLGEYDGATHLQRQLNYYVGGALVSYANTPATSFWQGTENALKTSGGNGLISLDAIQGNTSGVSDYDSILNTGSLMIVLRGNPSTNKEINSLPTNTVSAKIIPVGTAASPLQLQSPLTLLLDGWGNPIVYVPAGGLTNVSINQTMVNGVLTGGTVGIVTSTGFHAGTTYTPTALDRPFFASAGPDGDLSHGDDNIYSFEK